MNGMCVSPIEARPLLRRGNGHCNDSNDEKFTINVINGATFAPATAVGYRMHDTRSTSSCAMTIGVESHAHPLHGGKTPYSTDSPLHYGFPLDTERSREGRTTASERRRCRGRRGRPTPPGRAARAARAWRSPQATAGARLASPRYGAGGEPRACPDSWPRSHP